MTTTAPTKQYQFLLLHEATPASWLGNTKYLEKLIRRISKQSDSVFLEALDEIAAFDSFIYDERTQILAKNAMRYDQNLRALRERLVVNSQQLSEETFWKLYFWHVREVKHNTKQRMKNHIDNVNNMIHFWTKRAKDSKYHHDTAIVSALQKTKKHIEFCAKVSGERREEGSGDDESAEQREEKHAKKRQRKRKRGKKSDKKASMQGVSSTKWLDAEDEVVAIGAAKIIKSTSTPTFQTTNPISTATRRQMTLENIRKRQQAGLAQRKYASGPLSPLHETQQTPPLGTTQRARSLRAVATKTSVSQSDSPQQQTAELVNDTHNTPRSKLRPSRTAEGSRRRPSKLTHWGSDE